MLPAMFSVLTIAGSDSGGGAGIQADLKTFAALGVHGTTAVAAVTAQNTLGVKVVAPVSPEMVAAQIAAVVADIPPDAVKTGMLASAEIIRASASAIREHGLKNLVVDPVMVATSGDRLLEEEAECALLAHLLPLALVVTPNLEEAAVLTGFSVTGNAEMIEAARAIGSLGPRFVIVKGGHSPQRADDLFWDGKREVWLKSPRLAAEPLHGTGCVFSAALAAGLARGLAPLEAARLAKEFVSNAIRARIRPGGGASVLGWGCPKKQAED